MTDYRTMSGADFQRAVGTDPEKWAEAFIQQAEHDKRHGFSTDNVAKWFADAIEAGRKDSIREVLKREGE